MEGVGRGKKVLHYNDVQGLLLCAPISLLCKQKHNVCSSTAPLVLDVLRCTSVPPGDLCRVRSAPRAQLLVVEGRAVRSDKGEEFRSTPLVLAGVIFDGNAMGGFFISKYK